MDSELGGVSKQRLQDMLTSGACSTGYEEGEWTYNASTAPEREALASISPLGRPEKRQRPPQRMAMPRIEEELSTSRQVARSASGRP